MFRKLKSFFESARQTKTLSVSDLSDVITNVITKRTRTVEKDTSCGDGGVWSANSVLKPGDHVAVY